MNASIPLVSVVVRTHNRCELLSKAIDCLNKQTYPRTLITVKKQAIFIINQAYHRTVHPVMVEVLLILKVDVIFIGNFSQKVIWLQT